MSTKGDLILKSWHANADAWSNAVRAQSIESRKLITDAAIVAAVRKLSPRTVLDLGCGEGWLSTTLSRDGIEVMGIDAVERLIQLARDRSPTIQFAVMSYAEVSSGAIDSAFDVVVCNFSLFDDDPVEQLFLAVPKLLGDNGTFIVQTLHPIVACGSLPYQDGWREGSWTGCGEGFVGTPPWYFRTIESWRALFERSQMRIVETIEPRGLNAQQPASIIFLAQSRQ